MMGWAIETLVASSLLMLLVLALRRPVAAKFGAHAAYLLWLLPALRMILPRLPETAVPAPAVPIHFDIAKLVAAAGAPPQAAAAVPSIPAQPDTDWMLLALILWLAGAAVYLAWQLGRHHRFMTVALERAESGYRHSGIKVRLSPVISGPLAAGIFDRHILLPDDFADRYTDNEQGLALAHELAHHRRGDLIANAAALMILALHWFNPIAHRAYRAFRADQELACDATVLGRAAPETHPDYGTALIKSARAGMAATGACALGPAVELKRRVKMIAHASRSRARRVVGTGLATLVTIAGLGLTASGSVAAPSRIAPDAVKPIFAAASGSNISTRDAGEEVAFLSGSPALSGPPAPLAPTPPRAPMAPVAPVAPLAPETPVAPLVPVPPSLPVPPVAMSDAQIDAAQQQAVAASLQATAAAREALANIDIAGIVHEAMLQARAGLARECTHAKPAPANESDHAAIARLSAGCVDMVAINREVQDALREASEEIRNSRDLSAEQRSQALAGIGKARAQMARERAR